MPSQVTACGGVLASGAKGSERESLGADLRRSGNRQPRSRGSEDALGRPCSGPRSAPCGKSAQAARAWPPGPRAVSPCPSSGAALLTGFSCNHEGLSSRRPGSGTWGRPRRRLDGLLASTGGRLFGPSWRSCRSGPSAGALPDQYGLRAEFVGPFGYPRGRKGERDLPTCPWGGLRPLGLGDCRDAQVGHVPGVDRSHLRGPALAAGGASLTTSPNYPCRFLLGLRRCAWRRAPVTGGCSIKMGCGGPASGVEDPVSVQPGTRG